MTKFEPFQKVLVREGVDEVWEADFYSHYNEGSHYVLAHITIKASDEFLSNFLLPYNDETMHLLGTTDSLAPKWEPNPGELVAVSRIGTEMWKPRVFIRKDEELFICQNEDFHNMEDDGWRYCEPLSEHFKVSVCDHYD